MEPAGEKTHLDYIASPRLLVTLRRHSFSGFGKLAQNFDPALLDCANGSLAPLHLCLTQGLEAPNKKRNRTSRMCYSRVFKFILVQQGCHSVESLRLPCRLVCRRQPSIDRQDNIRHIADLVLHVAVRHDGLKPRPYGKLTVARGDGPLKHHYCVATDRQTP